MRSKTSKRSPRLRIQQSRNQAPSPTFQIVAYVRAFFKKNTPCILKHPSSFTGLFTVTIRQALFIAPCSHTFHYKCIKPLLDLHHPAFSCPLCRTFADLEEDVEVDPVDVDDMADSDSSGIVVEEKDAGGGGGGATPVPSVVPLPPVPLAPPERERDAGAETEVEGDSGAAHPARQQQRSRKI